MGNLIDPQKLFIVEYPDPRLRAKCAPVEVFDDALAAVADRMLELMKEAPGIGLAAPQVGLAIRLFVCNPRGEEGAQRVVVNPELSDPDGVSEAEEGCLSLPEVLVPMRRAERITLQAQDAKGQPFKVRGAEIEARVWQHEADHLDGRLIIDSMSEAVAIQNRRILKQLRQAYKASA
ncbi:MAG: peptide deformylase [Phycisphaerae bacterium]